MLRALKERKRTMRSERKRTWCPTLLKYFENRTFKWVVLLGCWTKILL